MRIHSVVLIAFAACLGAGAATVPARHPAPVVAVPASARAKARKRAPKTHQATGEVLSVTRTSLMLLHARGRTKQRMAFVLTPQTKKKINILKDDRITVYYQEDNGRRVALRIRSATRRSPHFIPVPVKPKH